MEQPFRAFIETNHRLPRIEEIARSYVEGLRSSPNRQSDGRKYYTREQARVQNFYLVMADAIRQVVRLSQQHPEFTKAVLGEDAYNTYVRLMEDRTEVVPKEVLPYINQAGLYTWVKAHRGTIKQKLFPEWSSDKQLKYIKSRTKGEPLTNKFRERLVIAALIDMFFKDKLPE